MRAAACTVNYNMLTFIYGQYHGEVKQSEAHRGSGCFALLVPAWPCNRCMDCGMNHAGSSIGKLVPAPGEHLKG